MYQPDEIDWRIIKLLNKDGRMSSAEISRRLGDVSARTVTNRIDALTEQGIINIRSIINPEKVGYGVLADVAIQVEPGTLRSVTDLLTELPQISYLACATGDTDIFVSVRATSIKELYDFVIGKLGQLPGVRHTETYLLPLNIKTNESWLPPGIFGDEKDSTKNSNLSQGDENE
jgi:DNA-binding Lrp family transcriptional regulator